MTIETTHPNDMAFGRPGIILLQLTPYPIRRLAD